MAEGDPVAYNRFKLDLFNGVHNLANGGHSIKVTLHTSYTPNIDTHTDWTDVSGTEYGSGGGYTAGGETLANQATSQDDANDRADFDADNVTWSSLTLSPATPSHLIMWNDTPTSPADPLMAYWELGSTATNGGDYTIAWHADGIALLS